jgi:hypothetical protein
MRLQVLGCTFPIIAASRLVTTVNVVLTVFLIILLLLGL